MPAPFELIAAPHTPFHPDGALALAAVDRQAEFLLRNGVQGVFACGTTGEGSSLTSAERMLVVERWVKAAAGRLKVIAHVGHNSGREAADLAAHAKEVGVAAVAAIAPHFVKPATAADLAAFLAPVAAACAPLPFLYYDIPALTGVRLNAAGVMEATAAVAPNFAGVKFTNGDAVTLQECLAAGGGRFDTYFGVDEMLLAALALGVRKAVGSTYNFTSKLHLDAVSAFDRGDWAAARARQLQSVRIARVLEGYGGAVRAGKAAMALCGLDLGPVRPPLAPVGADELRSLHADLAAVGGLNS